MAQIKVFGLRRALAGRTTEISDAIHGAVVEALGLPPDKRFHRFILLEDDEFFFPGERSENYTIIEVSMFEGRTSETKKKLINALYSRLHAEVGIAPQDLEITICETPRANWGIRGKPGDELALNYQVEV